MEQPTRKNLRENERSSGGGFDRSKLRAAKWYVALAVIIAIIAFTWYQIGAGTGSDLTGRIGELKSQRHENQGQDHITHGSTDHPPYNSNPASSGWHWPAAHEWGIYDSEIADEWAIHNLEHGGVWITYTNLSAEELELLKDIARSLNKKVLMSPRVNNDTRIALAGWTYTDTFDELDEGRIRAFYKAHKDKGPEYLPD